LIIVRAERPADIEAIRTLNTAAFGQAQESRLVDALRENGGVLLSLVATQDEQMVGHILFSPASIATDVRVVTGAGLGPIAVRPAFQRQGIGSRLIDTGVRKLRTMHCPFVVVLGHPAYYPRFGFEPASRYAIRCEWDVPDDAFMILVMDPAAMQSVSGLVKYRHEFSTVE